MDDSEHQGRKPPGPRPQPQPIQPDRKTRSQELRRQMKSLSGRIGYATGYANTLRLRAEKTQDGELRRRIEDLAAEADNRATKAREEIEQLRQEQIALYQTDQAAVHTAAPGRFRDLPPGIREACDRPHRIGRTMVEAFDNADLTEDEAYRAMGIKPPGRPH